MPSIEIEMLTTIDTTEVSRITNMINQAYGIAEEVLYAGDAVRTTDEEIARIVNQGEMAVARSLGHIVGCVRIRQIDAQTGGLGMLAVDDTYQGNGIGRKLVRFAEQTCQNANLQQMQLEVLEPREIPHAGKTRLRNWYTTFGYRLIDTQVVDDAIPQLTEKLAVPCQFVVYQKGLQG